MLHASDPPPSAARDIYLPDIVDVENAAGYCNNEGVIYEVENVNIEFLVLCWCDWAWGSHNQMVWSQKPVIGMPGCTFENEKILADEKRNTVDIQYTVIVSSQVSHSFCGEIGCSMGSK